MIYTDDPNGEDLDRDDEIWRELTTMNSTCQHPACTADTTDTYRDEHGNELALCENHYYRLVSGKSPSTTSTSSTIGLDLGPRIGTGGTLKLGRPSTSQSVTELEQFEDRYGGGIEPRTQ